MEDTIDEVVVVKKRTGDILKLIAIITMVIDHTGVLLYPDLRILRTIGRISFPIFAWLLVQGFIHTSDRKKYGLRFFYFALAAEIPYAFLNRDMLYKTDHYNVMYLLLLGLVLLTLVEKAGIFFRVKRFILGSLLSLIAFIIVAFPDVIEYQNPEFALSYGTYGLVMMLLFYSTRKHPIFMVIGYLLLSFIEPYRIGVHYQSVYFSPEMTYLEAFKSFDLIWEQITSFKDGLVTLEGYFFQARSILGLICIILLRRVSIPFKLPKYVGYAFYPVHITALILIRIFNGGPLG